MLKNCTRFLKNCEECNSMLCYHVSCPEHNILCRCVSVYFVWRTEESVFTKNRFGLQENTHFKHELTMKGVFFTMYSYRCWIQCLNIALDIFWMAFTLLDSSSFFVLLLLLPMIQRKAIYLTHFVSAGVVCKMKFQRPTHNVPTCNCCCLLRYVLVYSIWQ